MLAKSSHSGGGAQEAYGSSCPIRPAAQTLIDTPEGQILVSALQVGDLVRTQDASGKRVAMPLTKTGCVPAPPDHEMVQIVNDEGRAAWASPGHPTAVGRLVGELREGDQLDGGVVVSASRELYGQPYTYDVLRLETPGCTGRMACF
jgi:hypothetical protein